MTITRWFHHLSGVEKPPCMVGTTLRSANFSHAFQEASQKIYLLRLLRYLHAQLAHLIIQRLAQPLFQWAQRIAKFAFGFFVAAKVGCSDDAQSFSTVC